VALTSQIHPEGRRQKNKAGGFLRPRAG
jgi:hypothetical protein